MYIFMLLYAVKGRFGGQGTFAARMGKGRGRTKGSAVSVVACQNPGSHGRSLVASVRRSRSARSKRSLRRLAISRRGVEANAGKLTVRNLPDKGCIFVVDLPAARARRS
jgi:hypothetical protein